MVQLIQDLIPKLRQTRDVILFGGQRVLSGVTDFIRGNPLVSTASIGLASAVVGTVIGRRSTRRKKKAVTRKRTTRAKRRKTSGAKKTKKKRRGILRNTPRAKKGIRFTKKGQPFIILRSGKAKFIKKSSARSAKRRKGGFK